MLSHLTRNCYTVDNTQAFVSSIKNITNADKLFMCLFDVENLFANIPVHETIIIIIDKLFIRDDSTIVRFRQEIVSISFRIDCNKFFSLFLILEFINKSDFWQGPTFAQIFLCVFTNKIG